MKYTRFLVILTILITLLAACGSPEEGLLTVGEQEYSRSELGDLGVADVDYTDKDGETTTYSGVRLTDLLQDADLTNSGETLIFTAADGYQAELPMEEALDCQDCTVAFDDESLRLVMPDMSGKLQVKDLIEIAVQ